MKFKKVIFFLLSILCTGAFAQNIELVRVEAYSGDYEPIPRSLNYAQIQGSPYLDEELLKGYVKFRLGDSNVYYLRYNIYMDEMEYLEGEQLNAMKNASQLDHIFVNGHRFHYVTYKFRNNFKQGYLEKLVSGEYELYIKYDVDFEKKKEAQSSYDKATPARFVERPSTWYCSMNDGPIRNFETDKTSLEELFHENYPAIKNYIKDQKLKLRKQEDMIALFNYYNENF